MRDEHAVSLDLTGRTAIVTGASRLQGFGAAICLALASHGADILFTHWRAYDRVHGNGEDDAGPAELERRLRAMGSRVHALEVDLSQVGSASQVLDAARESLGAPSILVNNAAHSTMDGYEHLDATVLDAHYAVNVRSMALLSVEFARRFEGGSGGRIINLTSGQGVTPLPDELAYAATKGAVEAFTSSLAAGVASKGITVNAIDPGATDTGWMDEKLKAAIGSRMAFGRLGQPSDTARLAVFLASDAGQWMTGQVIHSRGA
ncbi:MAG TPA: SDR family oxidoreductase [Thermomicrobiales bacterium]|nr:SDR family oxidoreductase [Thermomicrobiales bacterium]